MSAVTSLPTFKPQFGVIVPTYNPGLEAWTKWVQALQFQNCKPMQVVVVDSGSTDGSLDLSQQAGFTLLHTKAQIHIKTSKTHDKPPILVFIGSKAKVSAKEANATEGNGR